MITYITGDILTSNAQALVNTVNTVGVMGKGIALQFKRAFPYNFRVYQEACRNKELKVGSMLVTTDSNLACGKKIIINFPTKADWRKSSEYAYITSGLSALKDVIRKHNIRSIAIPPLGAGNGGLEWNKVKTLIEQYLDGIDAEIYVYEPCRHIAESLKKERVKLTDARALLLFGLYDSVRNGSYVSEFSSEKICYFMQRLGAEKYFRLDYSPLFYGPYSGKVRHLLSTLNGSYIMGYSDMNKKPFEPLTLVADGYHEVESYITQRPELLKIAHDTTRFLNGFYSDFALELLSSVDMIMQTYNSDDTELVADRLRNWSDRKRSLFDKQSYIDVAIKHLEMYIPR